ncbi:MAG: outer membrane protein assembly factor BamB [Rhodocyclaceae bacterium]|nr:outer membrane protein assembly factor BamB [Rhodocyclaceae bacterium]
MRAGQALLLATLGAALTACGSFGSSRELTPLPAFVPGARLAQDWKASLAGSPIYKFTPAVIGSDRIIVAGVDGKLERLDQGKSVWRVELGKPLAAGVGGDDRLGVVVTQDGEAIAFDVADGSEKWRSQVGAEVLSAPAVTGIAVVVRASDSRVFGLAPQDGHRMWTYRRPTPALSMRGDTGMLTEDNVAVTGFPGGKMVAINLANGGALWELTVALPRGTTEIERLADVVGTPLLQDRRLCAAAFQGRLACFDASNGNLVWSRDISSAVGIGQGTGEIFITDETGAIHALDGSNGASIWKQDKLAGRIPGRPLMLGKYLVVTDAEGYVTALHVEDGSLAARAETDGSEMSGPPTPVDEDSFVVQSVKGGVFGFTLN